MKIIIPKGNNFIGGYGTAAKNTLGLKTFFKITKRKNKSRKKIKKYF